MILKIKCSTCSKELGERVKDTFTDLEIEETKLTTQCSEGHEVDIEVVE